MKYAMSRLRVADTVLKNRLSDFWMQREELMGSALRGFVLMKKKRLEKMLQACNRCLEQIPTDGMIDEHYRSTRQDVTFVKTASLNAKDRLPTPKPRKGSKDVKIPPPGITKQNSARDKARAPTPAHQLEKKILILEEMGFSRNSSAKALRESKGDTEQAVALLVAGNKAMKMMTGRKRTSTQPVPKSGSVSTASTDSHSRPSKPTPVRIVIKEYH